MSVDDGEFGIRVAIAAVWVEGVRRRNPGAVFNAVLALGATYLPDLIESRYDVEFCPWQRLYADSAMLTHAVGMLGPYDDVWWWDHLTHAHSATLLGGVVHVVARRRGRDPRPRVLGAVVATGVVWEVAEYTVHAVSTRLGFDPLLVSYGPRDTLVDLIFNLFGALAVVVLGDRLLGNFADARSSRGGAVDRADR